MEQHRILEELTGLLEAHGVAIRKEALDESGGGLCRIQGKTVLFLDKRASVSELVTLCADAVVQIVDIDNIYLRPELRQLFQSQKE